MSTDSSGKFYSVANLSERISETPEGFLICADVPITRAGDLIYRPGETPLNGNGKDIKITRTKEEISDPITIASFEGKPITLGHPSDFINPSNWKRYAVGTVQNVRPNDLNELLLADLLITDMDAIRAVKNRRMREVSCGYNANYIQESDSSGRQENIIGNHVALVDLGRCGPECQIFDHAPKKEASKMSKMKETIMGIFGKALDEANIIDDSNTQKTSDKKMSSDDFIKALESKVDALTDKVSSLVNDSGKSSNDEFKAFEDRMKGIEAEIKKLVNPGDNKQTQDGGGDIQIDSDTIARAEILSPGLAPTIDIKQKAIEGAYKTADGKEIIDSLTTDGKYTVGQIDVLFMAASELLKQKRNNQFPSWSTAKDQKSKVPTAEELNAKNKEFYNLIH